MSKRTLSDSAPQRAAETFALAVAARLVGVPEFKQNHGFQIGDGKAYVDGYFEDETQVIIIEVNARIGKMKTATKNKVFKDALKLLVISRLRERDWAEKRVRRILVFLSEEARQSFGSRSWGLAAFQELQIETLLCQSSPELMDDLRTAQRRQDLRLAAEEI